MCKELPIFVYGSLREGFFNYDKYLKGKVLRKTEGKTKGKLYHMPYKNYPALLDGDNDVYGEIMILDDYENTIKALDELEGYNGPNNTLNEYEKKIVDIKETCSGEIRKCYIYAYNVDNDFRFQKESVYIKNGNWKDYII